MALATRAAPLEPMAAWRTARREMRAAEAPTPIRRPTIRMPVAAAEATEAPEASAAIPGILTSAVVVRAVAHFPPRLIALPWVAEVVEDLEIIPTVTTRPAAAPLVADSFSCAPTPSLGRRLLLPTEPAPTMELLVMQVGAAARAAPS